MPEDLAAIGCMDTRQDTDKRRLARAISAEEGVDLTGIDGKIDGIERQCSAEPLGNAAHLEHRSGDNRHCAASSTSSRTGLRRSPMPSISISHTSPSRIQTGGVRAWPTPGGVPMAITSPGSSVMISLRISMVRGTSKIMSDVLDCCMVLPLSRLLMLRPLAPGGSSSGVTRNGPSAAGGGG